MSCGARDVGDVYTPPRETLAAASSRSNSKVLAARVVLAHPRTAFHPYTCGLRREAAAVAATLIGYNDVEEMIVINYFLYTDT
jgi:hypothetical protein